MSLFKLAPETIGFFFTYTIYLVVFRLAHGADVLWITSPALPALPAIDIDTARGKRTTQLNLNIPNDRDILNTLIGDADVFLQA